MKPSVLLVISKIFACINVCCALVVFYVLYITLKSTYEYPYNTYAAPDDLPFYRLLPLILFGIFILTGSVLFLFNKRAGWWLVMLVAVYVAITGFFVFILKKDIPYFLIKETTNFGFVFYIYSLLSVLIFLTNPVRARFKIFEAKVTPV